MTSKDISKKTYKRLKLKIEKNYRGKIIAIDPISGNYIIGEDELSTALKARKAYPGKIFHFFRIGHPAVHKFR